MENYISKKNKKNTPEKVELKKFCARCICLALFTKKRNNLFILTLHFHDK
ncbi:50S ribosomal protein L33 [Mycoplasmopsis bovis]|nr:50S ribosomal protein L33 [Mycoplasmopsis bovis]